MDLHLSALAYGFPWWLSSKESACNAGDGGSIPRSGSCPGEVYGNLLQYCCLGNPMGRRALQATVHGPQSRTWLTHWTDNITLTTPILNLLCMLESLQRYLYCISTSDSHTNPWHSQHTLALCSQEVNVSHILWRTLWDTVCKSSLEKKSNPNGLIV